jgi:hypothetical protein
VSSRLEVLVTRKELLVARASLQRLQAAHQVEALREGLRWPGPIAALATNRRALSVAGALLLFVLARTRFARAARWAGIAVAVLGIVRDAGPHGDTRRD